MEEASSCSRSRERLGLRFTIDYLLYNKGDKQGSRVDSERPSDKKEEVEEVWEEGEMEEEVEEEMEEEVEAKVTIEDLEEREVKVEEKVEGDEGKKEEVPSPWDSSSHRDWRSPRCPGEGLERSDPESREAEAPEEESRTDEGGPEEDKPPHSYIALISMAILSSLEKKLLLCDIYQWIMDHYPYFKSKDRNWRNSVRHNLSLNECFMKAGRSDSGKGHYWAIHPSNFRDFSNGDYHCRRARRRIRRMGAQPPYASLGTPGPYGSPLLRLQGAGGPCWCCPPPAPLLPRSCLTPWVYWCWAGMQKKSPPGILAPTMQAPILQAPTLQAPTLQAPILQAPTLQAPTHPVWLRG